VSRLLSRLTIPGGGAFNYSYNTRNLLGSVTDPDSVQVTFTYDDGGRRTRVTRPGSYIEYVYNARDWITAVRNRTTGGTVRYDALYYYNDGSLWDHTGNPLKRVENFGGSDFTTTLRYDNVYRETEETLRDSGDVVQYTHLYAYDEVGNRIVRNDGGSPPYLGYGYDANNKLTSTRPVGGGPPGPITANFYYDGAGNMTSVTGTEFGSKTLTYDDESRLSSIAYGAVTDTYTYNWQGLRTRAYLNGTWYRYLYNGERVLQELTNAGGVNATYTTENDSYYGALLHLKRATGESRFPLYDEIGSARGLVDASGVVTDTYDMDTFGRPVASTGSTPNPYRYGAAWGYMSDPSGFLQLGARYYWPEVGRFVSQDPEGEGINWYAYVRNRPTARIDPEGLKTVAECREDYFDSLYDCDMTSGMAQSVIAGGAIACAATGALSPAAAAGYAIGTGGVIAQNAYCRWKARRELRKCLRGADRPKGRPCPRRGRPDNRMGARPGAYRYD
jgi:RHS repeat-associated protein